MIGTRNSEHHAMILGRIRTQRARKVKNEMMAQEMCNTFKRNSGRNARTLVDSDRNTKSGEGRQHTQFEVLNPASYLCLFVW